MPLKLAEQRGAPDPARHEARQGEEVMCNIALLTTHSITAICARQFVKFAPRGGRRQFGAVQSLDLNATTEALS
jgi:hypothetical protein